MPLARTKAARSAARAERRAPRPCNIAGRCVKFCHGLQRELYAVLLNLVVLLIVVSNISSAASIRCERPPSMAGLSEQHAPSGAAVPHPVVIISAVAVHLSCSQHAEQLIVSAPFWGLLVESSARRAAAVLRPARRAQSVKHHGLCVGQRVPSAPSGACPARACLPHTA